jgi:hypothetical protein
MFILTAIKKRIYWVGNMQSSSVLKQVVDIFNTIFKTQINDIFM